MSIPQGSFSQPRRTLLPWDFLIVGLQNNEALVPSQQLRELCILQMYGKPEIKIITTLIKQNMYKVHSDADYMQY